MSNLEVIPTNPRISVIIACFQAGKTIARCLESILVQTFSDFEVILCDDGSEDDTAQIISAFAYRDSRITLLRSEKNQGAAAARNHCLDQARGEYIALQDADDVSSAERFEQELNFLRGHPEYDFVSCGMVRFDEKGEWSWFTPPCAAPLRSDLISGMPFVHGAAMFRRRVLEAVGGYRVSWETRRGQDYDLFLRLYAAGFHGANLPDFLYSYLQDRGAFHRKRYRYRAAESLIRLRGYRKNRMLLRGALYTAKPLAAGLLPKSFLRRRMQRRSSGPVRVLQVVSSLGCGGVSLSLLTLARQMDTSRVRFDYFAHCVQEDYRREIAADGVQVFAGKTVGKAGLFGYVRQWVRLLRRNYYDAVVIHTNYQAGLVAFCARLCGIPVRVCHIRGSYIYPDRLKRYLWLYRRLIASFATHRWACSQAAGEFYYCDRAFRVIPEPIDLNPYREVTSDEVSRLRKELGLPPRAQIWGHVGRFSREKNHSFLLRLLLEQTSRFPDTYLVMAGEGTLLEECKNTALRLGVIEKCRFLGNRSDIPALMQLFSLLLLPSLSEGFPNVAVQAQAAGIPALLSDRISREVDLGTGLVQYARHDDCEDWLKKIAACAGQRAEREQTHRILREKRYEAGCAAEDMTRFFEQSRKGGPNAC